MRFAVEDLEAVAAAGDATLLDAGTYHCSERTMSRVLAAQDEVRERRAQRRDPRYATPALLATGPNHLWSRDTDRLPYVSVF